MSNIDIPMIEGEKNPSVGFILRYELKVDNPYSVRWRMLNKDGTPLCEESMLFFEIVTTPFVEFIFLDYAAKQGKILEAWYKFSENDFERVVAISITPTLGTPAILTAVWQNTKGQDISVFSLETICLSIRTANIPVGQKLKVLLYDKESVVSDKFAMELSVSVGKNGNALLEISREVWLSIRKALRSQRKILGEDLQYQIYARVIYDFIHCNERTSEMQEIEKKSSILIMNNDPVKSIEELQKKIVIAHKSVVVNVPDECVPEEKIPVDLRIDVYFDGTMGNRWNIDAKLDPDKILDDGETAREKLKKNKAECMLKPKKKNDDGSSYDQVYTNIPIMYDLDQTEDKKKHFKVYVEGVGTRKYGKDENLLGAGAGTDMGGTGIQSKKQRMLDEIKKNVKLGKKEEPKDVKILVFGFSRGAATARSFLSHRGDIARVLKTSEANISFEFVGVFDTVSSVLFPDVESVIPVYLPILSPIPFILMPIFEKKSLETAMDNVEGLNLAMGANAKKVIHLTAGDEYRSFFKLTNIASSINAGVGFELELPGAHCDVGGGDLDEQCECFWVDNYKGLADRLIKEGWHTEKKFDQLKTSNKSDNQVPAQYVSRKVRAGYHKIPMLIMMTLAQLYTDVKYEPLKENYAIPEDLISLKKRMLTFAIQQSGRRRASTMHILDEPEFKWVRNKYLHLSAYPESGKTNITAIVKDTILERNTKEEVENLIPFMDGDYSVRPTRQIDEG